MKRLLPSLLGLFAGILAGCVTAPPVVPPAAPPPPVSISRFSALVPLSPQDVPPFEDDLDTTSLHAAAQESLAYYQNLPDNQLFVLGNDTYTVNDLAASMASLATLLEGSPNRRDWLPVLRENYQVYQSVGTDPDKTVVFSSYYEPTIPARLARDSVYKFPLYARPADLVDVDLSAFDPAYQGVRISGRRDGRSLVPYSTRADIDGRKILRERGLEIAWAKDPMDVLDLQIEGSGWLQIPVSSSEFRVPGSQDSKPVPDRGLSHPIVLKERDETRNSKLLRIRYDGDNGRKYKSVGQYLISTGRLPAKKFSRKAFLRYMVRHPQERQNLLNVNDRYIFFRIDASTAATYAYGNIDVPLTPGRSIATDPKLFPKGALAWIDVSGSGSQVSGSTRNTKHETRNVVGRFVLNQDEGGAIQGPGRVDIFAGHGKKAKLFATHLWNKGKLYFLVKKKT